MIILENHNTEHNMYAVAHKHKAKILIIDDEVDLTTLIAKRIRSAGYDVSCHFDGKDAIKTIKYEVPDLILLDLKLPDISGIDLYKTLKKEPDLKNIPVIFISAMHKEKDYCLNVLGAQGFITKPYHAQTLLNSIQNLLADN